MPLKYLTAKWPIETDEGEYLFYLQLAGRRARIFQWLKQGEEAAVAEALSPNGVGEIISQTIGGVEFTHPITGGTVAQPYVQLKNGIFSRYLAETTSGETVIYKDGEEDYRIVNERIYTSLDEKDIVLDYSFNDDNQLVLLGTIDVDVMEIIAEAVEDFVVADAVPRP